MTVFHRRRSWTVLPSSLLLGAFVAASGCGDDGPGEADATTSGGESSSGDPTGTSAVDADSTVGEPDSSTGPALPDAPVLQLGISPIKQFDFSWAPVEGVDYYQLLESADVGEPFVQIGGDLVSESVSLTVPLHLRSNASFVLRACDAVGCSESAPVSVMGTLAEGVGYFKASNPGFDDQFGGRAVISGDGNTLAVGAGFEGSAATGIDGDQLDDSAINAGAVYVYVRDELGQWSQQAYVKASNAGAGDRFGVSLALSADGSTLAVGAHQERSSATGIDGDQLDDSAVDAGAAYVFVRDELGQWSQQAYVKASNAGVGDTFGVGIDLSADGNRLAVGAPGENSSATGVDGDQLDGSASEAGAVYVFDRDGAGQWSQQAYLKASNTDEDDRFGVSVTLSDDGKTLVAGAPGERSDATGIDGSQGNDGYDDLGAAYVFTCNDMDQWSQQAYVKASNTGTEDFFGAQLELSGDGNTLAVGAIGEDSSATGIDGNQGDSQSGTGYGAVYVFVRDGSDQWSQQAYVKASNADSADNFGVSVALNEDGDILAVSAASEDSSATGIGGDELDESEISSGAVYVLVRDEADQWSQRSYVKAPNTRGVDYFGGFGAVSLDATGHTLAVGANGEDSSAKGVGGNQLDDSLSGAGAAYLY